MPHPTEHAVQMVLTFFDPGNGFLTSSCVAALVTPAVANALVAPNAPAKPAIFRNERRPTLVDRACLVSVFIPNVSFL
jgi:hypothetical protein